MANRRISQLPVVVSTDGDTSVTPVVSGGVTSQMSLRNAVNSGLSPATAANIGGVKVGTGLQVTVGGLLSAVATGQLSALGDTSISTPETGDVLQYDATSSSWVNDNLVDGGNF
jgi:hypothetical protein